MISNPTGKGKTSEAVILAALVRLGKSVLIPWGEERYDLALDEGGRLVRIQSKTGHIRDHACLSRADRGREYHHWRAPQVRAGEKRPDLEHSLGSGVRAGPQPVNRKCGRASGGLNRQVIDGDVVA